MKRFLFALSLVLLFGLFSFYWSGTSAHAVPVSSDQTQLAGHASYRTVDWDDWHEHHWRDHDFDREEHVYTYGPYYDYGPYPYPPDTYYYGPGFSVNTPFFGLNF